MAPDGKTPALLVYPALDFALNTSEDIAYDRALEAAPVWSDPP